LGNLATLFLAVALATDAFSVAASVAPRCCPRVGAVRLAGSFGGFQGLMPLLGALAGSLLYAYVRSFDHWVAFGLLELIGIKMIVEAFRGGGADAPSTHGPQFDPSRGWTLLGLSAATSIDAFGAGITLQIAGANLWVASAIIAAVTVCLTYLGARLGIRAHRRLGRKAELLGGAVLIALGIKMLQI
jgi:putative Mn2+ efflux pump MntP